MSNVALDELIYLSTMACRLRWPLLGSEGHPEDTSSNRRWAVCSPDIKTDTRDWSVTNRHLKRFRPQREVFNNVIE